MIWFTNWMIQLLKRVFSKLFLKEFIYFKFLTFDQKNHKYELRVHYVSQIFKGLCITLC